MNRGFMEVARTIAAIINLSNEKIPMNFHKKNPERFSTLRDLHFSFKTEPKVISSVMNEKIF